jgi:voltage-gated potassium channel
MSGTFRHRVFMLLENDDPRNPWGRRLQLGLILLILINVACVIFESEPDIYREFATLFEVIEIVSVLIFTVEFAFRVWSAVENPAWRRLSAGRARFRYMLTPMALVDLVSILPFWLQFITGIDLRVLRALRLLRVFKLTRYAPVVKLFLDVFREEAESILAAVFLMLVLMMVSSSLMFLAEHEAQPEAFSTIPKTMWWAVVTLTTVGYGDAVPVTVAGKVIASVFAILGIGMVALPTGILLAGLQDQIHRRRDAFRRKVDSLLAEDGSIPRGKRARIERLREDLGIDEEMATSILASLREEEMRVCPHCGKPLQSSGGD